MNPPATVCRELHRLHLRARDLRTETDRGPDQLRRFQFKIAEQEKQLAALQDKIKHTKTAIHQKEGDIKANNDKVQKHQAQMGLVTNKKEYDALRSEIDHDRQTNRVIEDQILELMLALDELNGKIPDLDKALKGAKDEQVKAEAALGGRAQDLVRQLAEAEAGLQTAEAQVAGELKPIYERLMKAYGADGLSPISGRSCLNCYTELTPQGYNDLQAGRMAVCKNCGRLLYLQE